MLPGLQHPGAGRLRPGRRLSARATRLRSLRHGPTDALRRRSPPAGGAAGASAPGAWPSRGSTSAPARGSTRAGWDRSTARGDTRRGASSRGGSSRPNAWPSTPRRSPRSAATSASTSSPAPTTGSSSSARRPRRSSSPSRSPRRSPSRPGRAMPGTAPGRDRPTASFLDARLFERQFAGPLEPYRDRVATLIFEFGTIPKSDLRDGGRVPGRLDAFLGALPGRVIATRSRSATPNTSARAISPCSPRHGVAHVFNAWTRMPRSRRAGRDARRLHGRFHGRPAPAPARADLRAGRGPLRAVSRPSGSPTRPRATPSAGSPSGRASPASRPTCSSTTAWKAMRPSTIEAVAETLSSQTAAFQLDTSSVALSSEAPLFSECRRHAGRPRRRSASPGGPGSPVRQAGRLDGPWRFSVGQAASRFSWAFALASLRAMIISSWSKPQKPKSGRSSPRCSYGHRPFRFPPRNTRVFQYSRFRSSIP